MTDDTGTDLVLDIRNAYTDTNIGLTENTIYIKNVMLLEYQEYHLYKHCHSTHHRLAKIL